jgi:hypothetical protein
MMASSFRCTTGITIHSSTAQETPIKAVLKSRLHISSPRIDAILRGPSRCYALQRLLTRLARRMKSKTDVNPHLQSFSPVTPLNHLPTLTLSSAQMTPSFEPTHFIFKLGSIKMVTDHTGGRANISGCFESIQPVLFIT